MRGFEQKICSAGENDKFGLQFFHENQFLAHIYFEKCVREERGSFCVISEEILLYEHENVV